MTGAAKGWAESDIPDLSGRVFVVTGANSGIGYEAARALAAKGGQVVLACRSREKGDAAAGRIKAAHPAANVVVSDLDVVGHGSSPNLVSREPSRRPLVRPTTLLC